MSKARKPRTTDARDEWRREQDACFNPSCKATVRGGSVLECHEIIGGIADRHKTIKLPAFWLALCPTCHNLFGSRPNQDSIVQQLAWKRWNDDEHYDAAAVIMLWRPNGTVDMMNEIVAAVNAAYADIAREHA